jgi:hypothetical protein
MGEFHAYSLGKLAEVVSEISDQLQQLVLELLFLGDSGIAGQLEHLFQTCESGFSVSNLTGIATNATPRPSIPEMNERTVRRRITMISVIDAVLYRILLALQTSSFIPQNEM